MAKKQKKEVQGTDKGKEVEVSRPARALSPFDDMDRWFDTFFPRGWMRPFQREWPSWGELPMPFEGRMPKVDVIDRDNEILVRAEIPGVEKDNLDISVTDNMVTIKGEVKHEEKEEKGEYYRSEISRGSFSRTVSLPNNVNPDAAKAQFKDGVLEVTIPKLEKAKRRSVKVD